MKTKNILFLMTTLLLFLNLNAQVIEDDPQWYVKNGMGWSGENHNSGNQTSGYVNLLGRNDILIDGVTSVGETNFRRNDLFIIFEDMTFFTNRFIGQLDDLPHKFEGNQLYIKSNVAINQMYWTNPYDNDDDPRNVRVSSTGGSNRNYSIESMSRNDIFAHQDIIPNVDIVLHVPIGISGILKFNQDENDNPIDVLEFVKCIGCTRYSDKDNEIEVKKADHPQYFIFHSHNNINARYINTYHRWQLNGALDGTDISLSTEELILGSHDPNYVHLMSVCKNGDKYFANYRVHFHNDGTGTEDRIMIKFDGNRFMKNSPCPIKYNIGGKMGEEVMVIGTKKNVFCKPTYYITFKGKASLLPGTSKDSALPTKKDRIKSSGYIDFCFELKRDNYEDMFYEELKLRNPIVYFGGIPTEINTFIPETTCPGCRNYINSDQLNRKKCSIDKLCFLPIEIERGCLKCECHLEKYNVAEFQKKDKKINWEIIDNSK